MPGLMTLSFASRTGEIERDQLIDSFVRDAGQASDEPVERIGLLAAARKKDRRASETEAEILRIDTRALRGD